METVFKPGEQDSVSPESAMVLESEQPQSSSKRRMKNPSGVTDGGVTDGNVIDGSAADGGVTDCWVLVMPPK